MQSTIPVSLSISKPGHMDSYREEGNSFGDCMTRAWLARQFSLHEHN